MKRINIELPEELHTNVKALAALKGTTLTKYLVDALSQALERDRHLIDRLKRSK